MSIWGVVSLESGSDRSVSIGDLEVRFSRFDSSWKIGLFGQPVTGTGVCEGWREVPSLGNTAPQIHPATPDLPIVLKPDNPIALVPGATVRYEVTVPLWIRITVQGKKGKETAEDSLADLPSHLIKRTWFGTGESGEVAYGWRFIPEIPKVVRKDWFTVPLSIKNGSDATLWFERLLLRVVHLDLYETDTRVVSNSVTVVFKGVEQFSQITYGDGKSLTRSGARKISSQRQSSSSDIIRKSFIWLRDLTA